MSAVPVTRPRNDGIDLVRGAVMVVMALDHARDIVGDYRRDPTDLATTTVGLFFTRWITHFCAPVFMLLAGTAAALYGARGHTRDALSRFLVTRGLWLIVLEVTVVRFGWLFDLTYHFTMLQVIWALGCCMVMLGGLVYLPRWAIMAFGVATVALHDTLDRMHFASPLWAILHEPRTFQLTHTMRLRVMYPLVPWVGVMALGYSLGPLFLGDPKRRRQTLVALGTMALVGFALFRSTNLYGDPHPWAPGRSFVWDVIAVLNCTKYPPSLSYLLMTLGPALFALAWADGRSPGALRPLVVFGRVPLFYYIVHLPVLHLVAAAALWHRGGMAAVQAARTSSHGTGLSLGGVYMAWAFTVLVLYLPCRWFAGVKQRAGHGWLSYL